MSLLDKILVANLISIVIPFVLDTSIGSTPSFIVTTITQLFAYALPLALLLLFFCIDNYKEPHLSKSLLRYFSAGLIWLIAIMFDYIFIGYVETYIMYSHIEIYVSYLDLVGAVVRAVCHAVILNLVVYISHCPARKPAELSNKQT